MKPITLHPVSVVIGLALAGLVALATSAQTISTRDRVVGYVPAEQWTYIQIGDGGPNPIPYTVPLNRRLVVTKEILANLNHIPLVNGQSATYRLNPVDSARSADGGNTRVVFQPGDVLGLAGSGILWYWGYLEPL